MKTLQHRPIEQQEGVAVVGSMRPILTAFHETMVPCSRPSGDSIGPIIRCFSRVLCVLRARYLTGYSFASRAAVRKTESSMDGVSLRVFVF